MFCGNITICDGRTPIFSDPQGVITPLALWSMWQDPVIRQPLGTNQGPSRWTVDVFQIACDRRRCVVVFFFFFREWRQEKHLLHWMIHCLHWAIKEATTSWSSKRIPGYTYIVTPTLTICREPKAFGWYLWRWIRGEKLFRSLVEQRD